LLFFAFKTPHGVQVWIVRAQDAHRAGLVVVGCVGIPPKRGWLRMAHRDSGWLWLGA
jgi:hypothetical protein